MLVQVTAAAVNINVKPVVNKSAVKVEDEEACSRHHVIGNYPCRERQSAKTRGSGEFERVLQELLLFSNTSTDSLLRFVVFSPQSNLASHRSKLR